MGCAHRKQFYLTQFFIKKFQAINPTYNKYIIFAASTFSDQSKDVYLITIITILRSQQNILRHKQTNSNEKIIETTLSVIPNI